MSSILFVFFAALGAAGAAMIVAGLVALLFMAIDCVLR